MCFWLYTTEKSYIISFEPVSTRLISNTGLSTLSYILQSCATTPNAESRRVRRTIRTDDSFSRSTTGKLDPDQNRHPIESYWWTVVGIGDACDARNVTKVDPVICAICRNGFIDLELEQYPNVNYPLHHMASWWKLHAPSLSFLTFLQTDDYFMLPNSRWYLHPSPVVFICFCYKIQDYRKEVQFRSNFSKQSKGIYLSVVDERSSIL